MTIKENSENTVSLSGQIEKVLRDTGVIDKDHATFVYTKQKYNAENSVNDNVSKYSLSTPVISLDSNAHFEDGDLSVEIVFSTSQNSIKHVRLSVDFYGVNLNGGNEQTAQWATPSMILHEEYSVNGDDTALTVIENNVVGFLANVTRMLEIQGLKS